MKMYGVWNIQKKEFQFGIEEPSKTRAMKRLFKKIGNDARKWRFDIREIKPGSPRQTLPQKLKRFHCEYDTTLHQHISKTDYAASRDEMYERITNNKKYKPIRKSIRIWEEPAY